MVDVQGEIIDLIAGAGIEAWRNRLPAGYTNQSPAATVMIQDDTFHVTRATRRILVEVRIWGGSAKAADCRSAYETIIRAVSGHNSQALAIIAGIRGQELPPDPDTGWPGYLLRFSARTKESTYGDGSNT